MRFHILALPMPRPCTTKQGSYDLNVKVPLALRPLAKGQRVSLLGNGKHHAVGVGTKVFPSAWLAGRAVVGTIDRAQARAQFDTNVYGTLWVVRAALPALPPQARKRAYPDRLQPRAGCHLSGLYNATKWAQVRYSSQPALSPASRQGRARRSGKRTGRPASGTGRKPAWRGSPPLPAAARRRGRRRPDEHLRRAGRASAPGVAPSGRRS